MIQLLCRIDTASTTGALPRSPPSRRATFLEIVDDRHGRGSTIVTSQLPADNWHEITVQEGYAHVPASAVPLLVLIGLVERDWSGLRHGLEEYP